MISPEPLDATAGDPCPHCGHEVAGSWLVCAWCGEQLALPAELPIGARIGDDRYQILGIIGRGGFGITYDVGDRRLQRRVAMKELFPESAVRHGSTVLTPPQGRAGFKAARERFLREARVLARFTHPGIVRVYEVFEENGTAYLVMELLDGRTLVELLQQRGRPFPEVELLDVAGRVATALRPVHAAGVLHRDVNPSNVMLTHHGRIVVIDFGLARDYDQDQTRGMTRVVTPGYAPLEQYRGEGRFGPSTDVYGLAATCYRLATGRVPVSAVERDAGAELPSPHKLNPDISKATADAILDGLELEPTHRPQDLDAFLARLGVSELPEGARSALIDLVPPPDPLPSSDPPRPRSSPSSTPSPARPVSSAPPASPPAPTPDLPTPPTSSAEVARPAVDVDLTIHEPIAPRPDEPRPDEPRARGSVAPMPDGDGRDGGATTVARTEVASSSFRPSRAPTDVAVLESKPPRTDGFVGPARRDGRDGGAGRPGVVGPPRRRRVLVPLAVAAIAVGSAAPVVAVAVLVLLVLPVLATMGDTAAHRMRGELGVVGGWAERRMSSGALVMPRFARNIVLSLARTSPVVVGAGVALLGWYGLEGLGAGRIVLAAGLRVIGGVAAAVLVVGARHGSTRFRSGRGVEELVARVVPEGRTTEQVIVLWIASAFLVAGALWLTPSTFPLP